jgi:retron-type reverse transcriptase
MSLTRDLSTALGISESDIRRIVATAPRRYKVYAIPKRSGADSRIIAQPARELKKIQRYIISNTLSALPIHPAATAYRKGKNIAHNAKIHTKNRVILKLDFRDFFHSIVPTDLVSLLKEQSLPNIKSDDIALLKQTLFWFNPFNRKLCLSIGAPSSPFISNAIMNPLDIEFFGIAKRNMCSYSRYADDITLSSGRIENLLAAEQNLKRIINMTKRPKLRFNAEKRGVFTTAGRRIVTGLVLTPEGKVSLGRARKREISAAIHRIAVRRDLSLEHINSTRGWLAYAKGVEPSFYSAMVRKYDSVVTRLMNTPPISRAAESEDALNLYY